MELKPYLDDGFHPYDLDCSFKFSKNGEEFVVDVYDKNDEWYAKAIGSNFGECLRHALHYVDPLLSAAAFGDNLEWSETHKLIRS